ncbi:hypothetical protein [Natrialba asiatica]|uniref:Uncharacterized protein n=1 Tax=Natrialba asiatica (strain ATCC 700177 / DSM 12278 / JCM 9576 / FERM P-10747 / NBRC 102637 / 172P1) TaxID=29540 RepID=M0AKE3_NATA1|nr:hypothetical protein [Natrialba asiatica]ELY98392.1 hypothetical protein C481_17222 [Natrialba asiatica DSM 12278]
MAATTSVTLPESVLAQYARFSLYNSPYPAHDAGCAIDLYPEPPCDGRTTIAPSPVSGTVRETRTVRAPQQPYAVEHDHLILIDCEGPDDCAGLTARLLHVDPTVAAGDRVDRGDSLGELVRAGFFAPWVDNHLHVGFRSPEQNPYRASGSLPLELGVDPQPLDWDGTGTVVATGDTDAILDAPAHPNPGAEFAGVHADSGEPNSSSRSSSERHSDGGGVLDGGLPHYDGGGLLASSGAGPAAAELVSLNGDRLGVRSGDDGRSIAWDDVTVTANGEPITGLSLFCARDSDFGVKLICPERAFEIGDAVQVRVRPER